MAIVKGCNLTPGCVFTVRGGGAASKENGVMWAGCCLRGSSPSRRGTFYMRPSTGSPLRADMESAPTHKQSHPVGAGHARPAALPLLPVYLLHCRERS